MAPPPFFFPPSFSPAPVSPQGDQTQTSPQGDQTQTPPCGDRERAYALAAGRRYFGNATGYLTEWLDAPRSDAPQTDQWAAVVLPDWATGIGVGLDNHVLVESGCIVDGPAPAYRRVDWARAVFMHLTGWMEQETERRRGPIHSYALRLPAAVAPLYDYAWVNRIFLFMRRAAAVTRQQDETALFGPRPAARFDLSHDVDAVRKTLAIRFKQGAFNLVNSAREAAAGRGGRAAGRMIKAARLALGPGDYWRIPALCALEESFGVRSVFHLFGGVTGWRRAPRLWLLDPSYRADAPGLTAAWRSLRDGGWSLGLHPSFDSWADPARLAAERMTVERAAGAPATRCRQHWLRFSWRDTWAAQEAAGLTLDATLGFNDRPGFRNGCALRFYPWNPATGAGRRLQALPLLLMDSHLYDYGLYDDDSRAAIMARWVGEVRDVGGEASLLWHTHVFDPDYGWADGYRNLLSLIA